MAALSAVWTFIKYLMLGEVNKNETEKNTTWEWEENKYELLQILRMKTKKIV